MLQGMPVGFLFEGIDVAMVHKVPFGLECPLSYMSCHFWTARVDVETPVPSFRTRESAISCTNTSVAAWYRIVA